MDRHQPYQRGSYTAELMGKNPGTIDDSQLKIVDAQGRSFAASHGIDAYINLGGESIFLEQVNPNVPVSGKAASGIAKDATGIKLQIEDLRAFSNEIGYV